MAEDLSNKVILITGSTDGLGKLVAEHLAARGAAVLLHGRSETKGEATRSQMAASTGNTKLEYYNADFSSLDEVRVLADRIVTGHDRLDLLINNAGIGGGPKGKQQRELSRDGIELRFAVNYLAPFLLTNRLLTLLRKSAPSRIINVSSIGQYPIDFGDVMLEKSYDSFRAYRQSKLAQIMFTIDLADELKTAGIIVNCLHPASLMDTNMVHDYFGSTMTTVGKGAEALEYVSTADETGNMTGIYFNGKYPSKADPQAYDPDARRKLKALSMMLAGIRETDPD